MSVRARPFQLMVDSGAQVEPRTRYFGSLEAALDAFEGLAEEWKPYVWVTELRGRGQNVVHVRDGRPVSAA